MSLRYLSQVRQELAIRLLARVYADGNFPSKVEPYLRYSCGAGKLYTDTYAVLVELHETEIHGQVFMIGMIDTASDHKISRLACCYARFQSACLSVQRRSVALDFQASTPWLPRLSNYRLESSFASCTYLLLRLCQGPVTLGLH